MKVASLLSIKLQWWKYFSLGKSFILNWGLIGFQILIGFVSFLCEAIWLIFFSMLDLCFVFWSSLYFLDWKVENKIHYNNNKVKFHIVLKVSKSWYKISLYSRHVYNKVCQFLRLLFCISDLFLFNDDFLLESDTWAVCI